MSVTLFDHHRSTLEAAVKAVHERTFFSAYPEVPSGKIYGETAKDDGQKAFEALLNRPFTIDQPGTTEQVGEEVSPYGIKLGVTYPGADLNVLLPAAEEAMRAWSKESIETRVGIALEILHQLNVQSFLLANAVMHTTGQAFMMAFQAGGPHAQDRGLEAVALAWELMNDVPREATWQKQVSKTDVITLKKRYHIAPRGVGAVVGCSTFPTWNSYPGFFASLVTGNAVVVKPHPGAVLPLALTVKIARHVIREQGLDPNIVMLAADTRAKSITKQLVTRPEVRLIDYTGSSAFGEWIEQNVHHAVTFTEKAGVNSVIFDSADDLRAVTGNLAFSLSLYSGQMCTTSKNIFVPRKGATVGGEQKSFDDIAGALVKAMDGLLGDTQRAVDVLGAIQNEGTWARVEQAPRDGGTLLRESKPIQHPQFPGARVRTPAVIAVDARDENLYMREVFGPVTYIVATDSTAQSIELARKTAERHGAITWSLYSTDAVVQQKVEDAALEVGVPLSTNLTGMIWVNQSAAFSDYHVSGLNPAGNASLTDHAFVAPRFHVVQSRALVPQAVAAEPKSSEKVAAQASLPHAGMTRSEC
jgi:phenylacetic acid degradation protein paaN